MLTSDMISNMLISEAKAKLSKEDYLEFLEKRGIRSEVTANFLAGLETGEVKGDYIVTAAKDNKSRKKELEMDEHIGFMNWMMPGVKETNKAKDEDADVAPPAPASGVDESGKKALHIAVGESLSKFGVKPTKDLYGVHAEEHGSAWVAPKEQFQALTKAMWQMGYRPGGKGIFKRGAVQIDMGQDDKNVYVYITDDNGPKVVVPGQSIKKKEVTKKEADGSHPADHYLVADSDDPGEWALLVKDADGNPDRRHMGAAFAALTVGFRGNKYKGPGKEEALKELKSMYHELGENYPGEGEE